MELDDTDRRLLGLIQRDSSMSMQALADAVGLTTNPCWRRIRRMEDANIILRRVAVVDPAQLGLKLTAFVTIKTDKHTAEWLKTFGRTVAVVPEIVECHRMTGDIDYLLKIVVRDLTHYDEVYRRFIDLVPDLSDVASTFSMERIKDGGVIDPATAQA